MQARHVMPPERILVEVDGAEVALTGRAASWNGQVSEQGQAHAKTEILLGKGSVDELLESD